MDTKTKRVPETISEAEDSIQRSLEGIRGIPFNDDLRVGLNYFLRPGYRPIVQLEEEHGRKKRSTAGAGHWNPDTGRVVVYFEKINSDAPRANVDKTPLSSPPSLQNMPSHSEINAEAVTPLQVQQCCNALADSERAGKSFISLKWFRDEALTQHRYDWTVNAEDRQRVLAKAIEEGAIKTERIQNPKNPQFPTTTVKLNRTAPHPGVTSRFNPVPVRGEPCLIPSCEIGKSLTFYFSDSSALVKLFVAEDGSDRMINLAQTTEDSFKLASVVAIVEVRSAIRRRQYAGDMSMKQAETAVRSLDEESRRMIQHPITSTIIELASALVDRQNLRALDSIQLATAISARNSLTADSKIQFVSSDQKLLTAAVSEGFSVWDPVS